MYSYVISARAETASFVFGSRMNGKGVRQLLIVLTGESPLHFKSKRRRDTFESFALQGDRFNLPVVVTTPSGLGAKSLRGWRWTVSPVGQWLPISLPLKPYVVYDAMFLDDLKRYREDYKKVIQRLKAQGVPYFNPAFPAKDMLYRQLLLSPVYRHVPLTQFNPSVGQIEEMLQAHGAVWLKPVFGSGGRDMLHIRQLDNAQMFVVGERFFGRSIRETMNRKQLLELLAEGQLHKRFMVQEHLPLVETPDHRKVDFRVTLFRNAMGAWEFCAVTARVGREGAFITNYHGGARVVSLTYPAPDTERLLAQLHMNRQDIARAIELAMKSAYVLSAHTKTIGVAGFDVGHTVLGRQFIYDCNSRPGRDILNQLETTAFVKGIVGFATYLHNQAKLEARG